MIVFCVTASLFAQEANTPFTIQGKFSNSPERLLNIGFYAENGALLLDTLHLDEEGRFYLQTDKVTSPQRISIQQNRTQVNDIYVAPGYDLTMVGDASDFQQLLKTLQITGKGAQVNQYRQERIAHFMQNMDTTRYWELNPNELAVYAKKKRAVDDSIAALVFDKVVEEDIYFQDFAKMVSMDNEFMYAYHILSAVNEHTMSYEESVNYIDAHLPLDLLADFSKEEFLQSTEYRNWALNEFVSYHRNLDTRRDPESVKVSGYTLNNVNKLLHGKVKDYYLNNLIKNWIAATKDLERLNGLKEALKPYMVSYSSTSYLDGLNRQFVEKEKELMATQIGQPTPAFTLQDDKGNTFSLADFKGQVVYIDLWASWCAPCREESPYLEKLYEKFSDDDRLKIIGIAVSDGEKEWHKALEEDKPQWLQLRDKEGVVQKGYAAYAIPQFVLIDKEGKIVDFNAPRPSSGERLESVLLEQMAR